MFDLNRFGLSDTFAFSAALPTVAAEAATLQDAAQSLTRYFFDHLLDKDSGDPCLALVQCHVTRRFDELSGDLQDVILGAAPEATPSPHRLCLVLLAAAGDDQALRDPHLARRPSAVLLPESGVIDHAPLAGRLIRLMRGGGAGVEDVDRVSESSGCVVAYVGDVGDSPLFEGWGHALPHGIQSVLGMGLPLADSMTVVVSLYAKASVPQSTVDAFTAVALASRLAILRFAVGGGAAYGGDGAQTEAEDTLLLRMQSEALQALLRARHDIALDQSVQLERALEVAEQRSAALAASQAALARSEARASAVVRASLDAVILMDRDGRTIEWNPGAASVFGYSRDEAVGAMVAELIVPPHLRDRHTQGIRRFLETGEGRLLNQRVEITGIHRDGRTIPVELTITAVDGAGGEPIFAASLRDITSRQEDQAALLASRESFAHVARTLQRSLLPAALPQVPGLDVGSVFHPSGAGNDVGGDFYDVFRVGRQDLFVTLGDVCGKGPEAATITAITRHTVRAVAPDLRHPSQILRRLNSALADHSIGERFCSMVAARVVPIVRGIRLSICCAGHMPPVVVRADGTVERVGVPGDLLGLFDEVRLFEETVQLGPGDKIVLYTDGVTEASRNGEEFGDERVERLLTDACSQSATEVVGHLLDAVLAFGGEQSRDDIAILALGPVAQP